MLLAVFSLSAVAASPSAVTVGEAVRLGLSTGPLAGAQRPARGLGDVDLGPDHAGAHEAQDLITRLHLLPGPGDDLGDHGVKWRADLRTLTGLGQRALGFSHGELGELHPLGAHLALSLAQAVAELLRSGGVLLGQGHGRLGLGDVELEPGLAFSGGGPVGDGAGLDEATQHRSGAHPLAGGQGAAVGAAEHTRHRRAQGGAAARRAHQGAVGPHGVADGAPLGHRRA